MLLKTVLRVTVMAQFKEKKKQDFNKSYFEVSAKQSVGWWEKQKGSAWFGYTGALGSQAG